MIQLGNVTLDADRDEFMAIMREAKPGMITRKMP